LQESGLTGPRQRESHATGIGPAYGMTVMPDSQIIQVRRSPDWCRWDDTNRANVCACRADRGYRSVVCPFRGYCKIIS